MRVFITGGCKNGKSTRAERLALLQRQPDGPLHYIATMVSSGQEDDARIRRHQASRRGLGFETIEAGRDIHRVADGLDPAGSVLLDSVTALFLNEMLTPSFDVDPGSTDKVAADLAALLDRLPNIVLVSDYIYSDAEFFNELTEFYRSGLARLDRLLAGRCDVVIEACYGSFLTHKGAELLAALDPPAPDQPAAPPAATPAAPPATQTATPAHPSDERGDKPMRLIIGGAHQGKLDYVQAAYPGLKLQQCSLEETELDPTADAYDSLHLLALAQLRAGIDTLDYLEERLDALQGKVLIADDISSGVVPIDAEMREWREVLGRSLAMLSRHADEVTRLFCGIASRIK